MFDIKQYITEINDGQRYQKERQDAVLGLNSLASVVDNFRSPAESGAAGHDPENEKDAANIMAKFVDKVNKLQREWFNMSRRI